MRTINTASGVIELGDVIEFTPRHERHLGTVVAAVVVSVTRFGHCIGASHFTAVTGSRRFGFPLIGHNGRVSKGSAENVETALGLEALLLHKRVGGVWTDRYRARQAAKAEA